MLDFSKLFLLKQFNTLSIPLPAWCLYHPPLEDREGRGSDLVYNGEQKPLKYRNSIKVLQIVQTFKTWKQWNKHHTRSFFKRHLRLALIYRLIVIELGAKLSLISDAIRWEEIENLHFLNWWSYLHSKNLYLFLFMSSKSCFLSRTCINVLFISSRLMKNVRFRTVPIWLLHTIW